MGNLQRLGLARALLHEPTLLISTNQPTGLTRRALFKSANCYGLSHKKGVTIFMSSHILTEVDRLATRIGIIHHGKLIDELDTAKLEQLRARRGLKLERATLEPHRPACKVPAINLR